MFQINTGNIINYWGPKLTPYARAIMSSYRRCEPLFLNIPTTLTGVVREQRTVINEPFEYDVLIIGANINMGTASNGSNGQQIFLNVSDLQTGIDWSTPGPIDCSPAVAYGGSRHNAMPVLQLPEAFFLPAGVRLRHLWRMIGQTATGGTLTWIAIQLIDPIGGKRPSSVQMPDGSVIPVGSRIPWFSTIGLGTEISVLGSPRYVLARDYGTYVQFCPAADCEIEIHDIVCNFFTQGDDVSTDPENILIGLADRQEPRFWTPVNAPSTAVFGDYNKAYIGLPLTKPYLLKKGHRLQITTQNGNNLEINNAFVTVRGVRKCDY